MTPESANGGPPLVVTRRQLVGLLGISVRGFADLEAAGVVTATRPGRGGRASYYDLATAIPQYIRHVERTRAPNGEREARARRDAAQAALAEQLVQKRAGELMPIAEVKRGWLLLVHAARTRLLALPATVAEECAYAADPRAIERILDAAIRDALTELASGELVSDAPPTPNHAVPRRTSP